MIDLPGYTLLDKAYEGAETVLFRGRREDGTPVAVKRTRGEFPTARELCRLRREFALLEEAAGVPGVVRGYAIEKCGRGIALVMEDLGPCSLHSVLAARRLDVGTSLEIAIALSGTLDALHGLRILHKDIKPHNVMIDEATGRPCLVDFGIAARLSQEAQRVKSPDALEGTLAYIAPEQTGRMNRVVDLRADLYSLGVTLYEMLTGALPFEGVDPTEMIHSHMARTPTPPHERSEAVPAALSAIVMRLLSKTPEERYQSARGLKVDLEACLRPWQATGRIDPFPLGQRDLALELRIPQKLYGREEQVLALLSAFERARRGAGGLILVSGYSGVGKSSLVGEIHKPVASRGGSFVRGKFDPICRDVPLAPVAHALRELIRQILTEPAGALAAWKEKLLTAVGANGRLLVELIPELELVLGPQPEVQALGPKESQNRFASLVQRFLQVFASAGHPLALFLDDLQWADPASLKLLGLLLGDPDLCHLLVVGAYRDNEVDAAHPLRSALDELRRAGALITELTLGPLAPAVVTQLLADTLSARDREVEPLSALLFDKTQGNPFFLSQLLRSLHEGGALFLDAALGAWAWDLGRVRGAVATDNVIDLMLGRLRRLTPATQRVLKLASCMGHEFDLATLAIMDQRPPARTAADLWEALREGLILPLDSDYRLFDESAGAGPSDAGGEIQVSYRFLHDRVLQAAYSLIEPGRTEEVHREIGRLLWARSGEAPRDEDLLEIVRHLNLGGRGLTDEAERVALARLNLRAGRRVKGTAAYQAAADYFGAGAALLGEAGWDRDDDLCFALAREGAECAYLGGAPERAEALFSALLLRARSSVERARIHNLRVVLYTTLGQFADAVRAGREGLAVLGVTLPETEAEQQASFGAELAEVAVNLGDRRVEDLIDAPVIDDPERRLVMQIVCDVSTASYFVSPTLYGTAVLKQVNLSLKHGHSDVSAFSYMAYGFILATMLDRPAEGHAFGLLALRLNDRFQNAALTPTLAGTFSCYLYMTQPVRASGPFFQKSRQAAIESGDLVFLAAGWHAEVALKFGTGYQLEEIREEVERGLAVTQRTKDVTAVAIMTLVRQAIASLQGRTRGDFSLSDDAFNEEEFCAKLDGQEQGAALFYHALFKLELLYLQGDFASAALVAEEAEARSISVLGMYSTTRVSFYACLALLALPPAATAEEGQRRAEAIARHKGRIAGLAVNSPENFEHQRLLLEAEEARVAGRPAEAMDLYDRAIALAWENEFPHDEALANELCAKLHVGMGRTKVARVYMTDAYLGYRHWGATAKTDALARQHASLLPSSDSGQRASPSASPPGATTGSLLSRTTVGSLRDAALIVRAAQDIAGETELERVIQRLVTIVLENAGAQRGALLLERDGRLFVEATFGIEPEPLVVGLSAPLETRGDLPQSVARIVARTREPLVLDDASADARFSGDPYIAGRGTKSVLCLPLVHQGRLSGVLYLAHDAAAAAFNEARVELLGLLASQAAISIENAELLSSARAANEQVRHINAQLEAEVAERVALQEQRIEAQRIRLAELSTPLMPITDRIMVMPLIGAMDAERASQVLEAALQGAQRHQARVMILDVTGLRDIDTPVAGMLAGTASALRLLGTQTVLTGIRAEAAQAMIDLDIDLRALVTLGTLQSGFAYALQRSGESGRLATGRGGARASK